MTSAVALNRLEEALRGSGYGAVQGAVESGSDPAEAVTQSVRAARELAGDVGLTPDESAAILAEGALEAAKAVGGDTLARCDKDYRTMLDIFRRRSSSPGWRHSNQSDLSHLDFHQMR